MFTEYKYKKQKDKSDSWEVKEYTDETKEEMTAAYMVYEDPTIEKKIDVSKFDFSTLTADQITQLKDILK